MSIKCGNPAHQGIDIRHETVADVRVCFASPNGVADFAPTTEGVKFPQAAYPLATDKQVEFLRSLMADRITTDRTEANWSCGLADALAAGTLGKRDASTAISRLQGWARIGKAGSVAESAQPFGPPVKPAAIVTQDGMYRNPETGEIFKVQWNRASGDGKRLYAKRLVLWVDHKKVAAATPETAMKWDKERDCIEFQYAPGVVPNLRPEWRMTLAEAREFGALYGTCVRCGRTLTREDSIERMMGPVCAGKGNWA